MDTTLGCIGCGNMGGAILKGLAGRKGLRLICLDVDAVRAASVAVDVGGAVAPSIEELFRASDYVLLAVKPYQVRDVLAKAGPELAAAKTVLSIAAGVTVGQLRAFAASRCPVVRIMPNTPAMVGAGVFALCLDDPALAEDRKAFVRELFAALGQVHVMEEKYFDAFTAVIGCGPAYVFYFMEALIESAVTLGFTRPQAQAMVFALFSGSAKLAETTGTHPALLREMVTSPAGATIAATNILDKEAARGLIIEAVKAACARSAELGK
jgi:pyrroline-5-carboxylate reductase